MSFKVQLKAILTAKLTIVLSELKLDSEQVPNNLSWHFLCTAVWQAKNIWDYEEKKYNDQSVNEAKSLKEIFLHSLRGIYF